MLTFFPIPSSVVSQSAAPNGHDRSDCSAQPRTYVSDSLPTYKLSMKQFSDSNFPRGQTEITSTMVFSCSIRQCCPSLYPSLILPRCFYTSPSIFSSSLHSIFYPLSLQVKLFYHSKTRYSISTTSPVPDPLPSRSTHRTSYSNRSTSSPTTSCPTHTSSSATQASVPTSPPYKKTFFQSSRPTHFQKVHHPISVPIPSTLKMTAGILRLLPHVPLHFFLQLPPNTPPPPSLPCNPVHSFVTVPSLDPPLLASPLL